MSGKIPRHLLIISVSVFLFLNIIENIIHYSIGRNSSEQDKVPFNIYVPETLDFIKIILIMIIFAILQGLLTYLGVFMGL